MNQRTREARAPEASRIMIVDDHPIVRTGVAALLDSEPDLEVVCEASSEGEAVAQITRHPIDVAIVDLTLSHSSGLALFQKLQRLRPGLRILVLSMHDEAVYAEKVLQAGAHGYLMKQAAADVLLHALRSVIRGDLYVSPQMLERVLRGAGGRESARVQPAAAQLSTSQLTVTETKVLHLISMGLTNAEIAGNLHRSSKTIDTHRSNIKRKLNIDSNLALYRFALQWGDEQVGTPPEN